MQAVLVVAVAAIYFALRGGSEALAALYGGAIALTNSALLAWRSSQADRAVGLDAHQSLGFLVRSALERYAAIALLFALGMGLLELTPLPMLIGFVIGLAALFGLGTPTTRASGNDGG